MSFAIWFVVLLSGFNLYQTPTIPVVRRPPPPVVLQPRPVFVPPQQPRIVVVQQRPSWREEKRRREYRRKRQEEARRRKEAKSVWMYGLRYGEGPLQRDKLPKERKQRRMAW